VVAGDVSPADLIILHSQGARGLITESGGPLSHTSILARSLGIPALVGLRRGRRLFREEEEVALDGTAGTAVIAPEPRELRFLRRRQRERSRQAERTRGLARRLPRTRDGTRITLRANIELPGDLRQVNQHGIQGIGLYRTEFLYMNRAEQPPENEQLRAYLRCLRAAAGQPVTIRTADLDPGAGLGTRNPALGMRGIRRSLNEPTEFLVQLRALLRAAAQGTLEIMLPMVSAASEIRRTRRLLQVAHESLSAEGVGHGWPIRLGAMIETPAAALQAGAIAAEADFLSLGTNDLIQYTLAIDRNEEAVNYLYNPLHPAVLRLIDETVKAGRRAGIRVAICGEMAADTRYTALLAGLGLREFSVRPAVLQEVRGRIHEIDIERVARSARRLLSARSVNDSEQRLQQLNRRADSQSGH
jgi:phosphotransferase system enzyme I (PtsI)